ncbi:MAG: transporter substrate-binding protein [Planctomycetes bacterium]|nr:transporter substrate-binding protein [Planctomycetota bacterium]
MKLLQIVLCVALVLGVAGGTYLHVTRAPAPLRVGILTSQTGGNADAARPVLDATIAAIITLNRNGGLLGVEIVPVMADGASDTSIFAREAERLLRDERVCVIFGGDTSAARKALLPVLEAHDGLLMYPMPYEGLERAPHVVYLGAAPNQSVLPAVRWAIDRFGSGAFLVGQETVYSRVVGELLKDEFKSLGSEVVGEEYLPVGSEAIDQALDAIRATKPKFVFNSLHGPAANKLFFGGLQRAGYTPEKLPVVSLDLRESDLAKLDIAQVEGHYVSGCYFQSVDTPANVSFVAKYQRRYGKEAVTDAAVEAAYTGVLLWGKAVKAAGGSAPAAVRDALVQQDIDAPAGTTFVDPDSQAAWRMCRIGQVRRDGQVAIVWASRDPLRPKPYPRGRSVQQWHTLLTTLTEGWGGKWEKTGDAGAAEPEATGGAAGSR